MARHDGIFGSESLGGFYRQVNSSTAMIAIVADDYSRPLSRETRERNIDFNNHLRLHHREHLGHGTSFPWLCDWLVVTDSGAFV